MSDLIEIKELNSRIHFLTSDLLSIGKDLEIFGNIAIDCADSTESHGYNYSKILLTSRLRKDLKTLLGSIEALKAKLQNLRGVIPGIESRRCGREGCR